MLLALTDLNEDISGWVGPPLKGSGTVAPLTSTSGVSNTEMGAAAETCCFGCSENSCTTFRCLLSGRLWSRGSMMPSPTHNWAYRAPAMNAAIGFLNLIANVNIIIQFV